ncbi:DUF1365 domain-containing protein [Acidithiobacillus sp. IBUN Pt1247-S3]|uniref:DUF1365 domain-containing protein n=1 Tax=Acidithiobacillus sp. IBUN Pt1247-S3 TaxID=3166642 RepID=UPI0034E509E3
MAADRNLAGALLPVRVMHQRLQPKRRAFHYRGFQLCFEIGELAQLQSILRRWTPLAFRAADHGQRSGADLATWIRSIFATHQVVAEKIYLVTYPRLWGYAFKPVSFWMALDGKGEIRAVLAEVNNTFGEHHSYLVRHPDGRVIAADDWITAEKAFYVSPFFAVDGQYRFRFRFDAAKVQVDITHLDPQGRLRLATQLAGKRRDLTIASAWRVVLGNPLMTFVVTVGIHWEALKTWRAGIRLQRKPVPPSEEISL